MTWAGETWVITDPELALQTLMSWRQMESSLTTITFNPYALQQERRWWRADIQSIQVYTCRPIHRPPCLLFPRPTARVLIATPSRFFLLEWLWWTDHRHHACARAVRFRCQIEHFSSTISSLYFFFGLNENVPPWMEWTRKHQNLTSASANSVFRRRDKRRDKRRARAATPPWRTRHEQSRRAEETSQKRLKAERQRDGSRRQCQTAEQRARWLIVDHQSAVNYQQYKSTYTTSSTRVLTQPATSSTETMWARTSKAWTRNPVPKLSDQWI